MFLTIITFIIVLSILVFVHEFGHFIVARIIGVHVEEFGFGLPPRIIGKKIGRTIYSLNWLPIGGFVRLAGEDDSAEDDHTMTPGLKKSEYFWARKPAERSAILVAGVTMNFILATVLTAVLLVGGVKEASGRVHLEAIVTGAPASAAGLKPNDIIKNLTVTMNNIPQTIAVKTPNDLIANVKNHLGEPVILEVMRGSERMIVTLTPRKDYPKGQGPMGVAVSDLETKKYPIAEAPFVATKLNIERAWLMLTGIVTTLWKLITFKGVAGDVAGPIGIAQVTGQAIKFGFRAVLDFMAILSLNLAVLNILPLPALDGGRLAFIIIEKIIGRKVKPAFEKQTHQIGMLILLFLILLVSINDIMRLARGG